MALGRGLDTLLGEVELSYDKVTKKYDTIFDLNLDEIHLNPKQPRKEFNETKLKELSNSIKTNGLLQPIVVIQDNEKYILVSGERRLRASKMANLPTIKAIILDTNISRLRELALIENIQREDLNIIELAICYNELIKEHNLTHEELAKNVSKSRTHITNTLRLLNLSDYVKEYIIDQKISAGHGKVLVGLDEKQQKIIVDSIINQNLSVRETELLIKSFKTRGITSTSKKTNLDLKPLDSIVKRFENDNLKVKISDKYIKIDITSQEDIEKFLGYFDAID